VRWPPAWVPRGALFLGLVGLCAVLCLAEPALAQETVTIIEARSALDEARSDRAVRALAASELDAAEQALEQATAASDADRPASEVGHLAYLAERRAAIARMQARQRRATRALDALSATHSLIQEARALEAAAAGQRTRELAAGLKRFEVQADQHGVVLMPRRPWFETDLKPTRHAVQAIAEAARLLDRLPDRQVVVVGYAASRGSSPERGRDLVARRAAAPAGHDPVIDIASDMPGGVADGDDLGCARADVVRAFLISNGGDPRRIVTSCVVPDAASEPSSGSAKRPLAGETSIAILPRNDLTGSPLIVRGIDQAVDRGPGAP
jgi:outer membrane protein OmpA-like peptidoglycan-associated protein